MGWLSSMGYPNDGSSGVTICPKLGLRIKHKSAKKIEMKWKWKHDKTHESQQLYNHYGVFTSAFWIILTIWRDGAAAADPSRAPGLCCCCWKAPTPAAAACPRPAGGRPANRSEAEAISATGTGALPARAWFDVSRDIKILIGWELMKKRGES